MKVNFYLDKPYNPDIASEKVKQELAKIGGKKKNLAQKFWNPSPTALYLFFSPDKSCRIKYRTNYKILPKSWDFEKERLKPSASGALEFNVEMNNLANLCIREAMGKKDKNQFLSKEDYKQIIQGCIDRDNAVSNEISISRLKIQFLSYKSNFVKEGTLKEYRTVFKGLEDFEKQKGINLVLRELDSKFLDQFEVFLSKKRNTNDEEKEGLLNDTIHKYISTLKVFLKWCNDNDYLVHPDVFKTQKTNFKKKAYNEIIALSEAEIEKLMNHDLSDRPSLERVRDLFCLLCYTGQRFEDLINFDPKDIKNNAWDFISVKVKKRVIVPFEGYIAPAKDILERIGYNVPKISNQKFNEYIKTVGKLAGLDETIKITRYSGKQKLVIEKRKYDFLSSHVGRRSMVTNLLSRNVPITLVQKLTAHSDIRTLMKYESASTDSLIDALNKF
ncbi:site-specific integrase [Sphingobacterium hotanense]|uniref:Tyrosine-type recombinase/integrase n=1 Tax=Sphingobacterium hotanense TaxID=649196 RepID=A0ABT7NTK0_9SPHI|nr:tyrosine-type recombinase/integrase [Sphingobacterium hotanense]MDM1050500.1 tyrosine-type recombinase/integrase [Sphingobacterium hotanense]